MNTEGAILVVEDNPLTSKMLRLTLEVGGYSVLEAPDGRTALALAAETMPALILQDLILPDMSGFELVRHLRALPGGAAAPIVALSGFLGRIDEARSLDAGFSAVLVKPVEPSRLLESVELHFPRQTSTLAPIKGVRVLVVDDDVTQLKLTRLHLEPLGFEVATAAGAHEALRRARSQPPDVVLSDVFMPELDGFDFCREWQGEPTLADIPVVLWSAYYQSQKDRELAKRVGAAALVVRTDNVSQIADALAQALRGGRGPATTSEEDVRLEHAEAIVRQLDRQLKMNVEVSRRCTLQAAQISLLSGVADALSRRIDSGVALRDVLAATLDAAGISKGAILLREDDGPMSVRHAIGFSPAERVALETFFGEAALLAHVVDRHVTLTVPSFALTPAQSSSILAAAGAATIQIVPLVGEGRSPGAILLAARSTDVTNEDSISFARAMGNQVAQSLQLASSFARLAASEQRYRAVTEAANDAISILTEDGTVVEANLSLERAFGLPRDCLIGRKMHEIGCFDQELQMGSQPKERSSAGVARTSRRTITRSDGTAVQMEFSDKEVDVGGTKLVFSIGRDVTDQVNTQAQLMVSDRLASVGMLAAGVAHEINNPLAAVVANLECASSELSALMHRGNGHIALKSVAEEIGEAANAAFRMRQIVNDLRIFSRSEDDKIEPVDVRTVIDSALRIAWNEIRHRAKLSKEYSEVPMVAGNESRLGQVFLNLVVNAIQAMPGDTMDRNSLVVKTGFDASKERVFAEVADNGCGMSLDVQRRLFTPFFTTKPRGVGTGLGLAICQRIVTALGGTIEVESQLGIGTVCRVLLRATVGIPTRKTPRRVDPGHRRRGRILIVDDESLIISVVRRVLSDHEVVGVTDARDALSRLDRGETFDLILCDLMMPGLTGMDFWQRLTERGNEHSERIVFLTGGAITPTAQAFFDTIANQRIDKPFESAALKALVNERLN